MRFILALTLIALSSCGQAPSDRVENSYIDSSTGRPVKLIAATEFCNKSEGKYEYALQFPSKIGRKIFKIDGPNPLKKYTFLSSIDYQGEFHTIFEINHQRGEKNFWNESLEVIEPSRLLTLCPDTVYEYFSYEDASMKVLMALEDSYESLKDVIPENISKVEVKIAPIMHFTTIKTKKKTRNHEKKTLVNNAMYFANKKQIVFLPVGTNEDGIAPFNGIPFWDIPLISAHEYGHHLFSEIVPFYKGRSTLHAEPCFDNRVVKNFFARDGKRRITNRLIWKVLDEGSADMLAHYSLEKGLHNIDELNCLAFNREVDSGMWLTGDEKKLDEETIEKFFNEEKVKIISCAIEVDFQDEHILGANIANFFDTLFTKVSFNNKDRLTILVKWIKILGENESRLNSMEPRAHLKESINFMLKLIRQSIDESKIDLCPIISKKAPILSEENHCK